VSSGGRVWFVVTALVFAHLVLHVAFGLGIVAPDLLVVAVLVAARELGLRWGASIGLAFGLLEDAFSVLSFGANALALAVVGAFAGSTRDLFVGDSRIFLVSYLFVGKWTRDFIFWLASSEALRASFVDAMLERAVLSAVYVVVVGVLAFWFAGLTWAEER
jgi:rod shape-determining protein MreD